MGVLTALWLAHQVIGTMDAMKEPGENECPLCIPGQRCHACQFHKRW